MRRRYCQDFRDVADAAGVPRAVDHPRALGGATEAQEAGVGIEDIAEPADQR